jgi:hypothetical protein
MKQSVETTRFLNHIERERNKIRRDLNAQIEIEQGNLRTQYIARTTAERDLQLATARINTLESELAVLRPANDSLLQSARTLLPKIRVNIYTNSTSCTPRWFRTGKWWSRETGGLDPEFVAEMTADEISEAVDFYGKTELPLMLPRSNHQRIEESIEAGIPPYENRKS